jgi:RNA polymerase sigma factor (sigma-70 family)
VTAPCPMGIPPRDFILILRAASSSIPRCAARGRPKQFQSDRRNLSVSPSAAAEEAHESDEVLMERLRDGDEHAFDALFERHAGSIHRFLSRRVDDAQAEDLTQETFLSVIRARGRYLLGRSFRNWLYAIASNAARHHLRAQRREGTRLREAAASLCTAALDEGAGIGERAVREALALLPDAQREVIMLHAYEGMTFAEIADVLGMSGVTVRVRAHRAYRRLRELLAPVEEER